MPRSPMSTRITPNCRGGSSACFLPPYFQTPQPIAERDIVPLMNAGEYTFVIDIPPNFERDVLGGREPAIQVNVDATAMVQAGLGSGYVSADHHDRDPGLSLACEGAPLSPVNLDVRIAFNPNVTTAWFTSVMGIINNVTMLAIILAGAAIVREREHGTMDHLLVMPLTPFEIAMSKVWANGLVITVAVGLSLYFVVRTMLGVPIAGSMPLFMFGRHDLSVLRLRHRHIPRHGRALHAAARLAVHAGLFADEHALRQQHAAGKHAALAGDRMQASPSTHFVSFAQSILYRGAGIDVVWPQFVFVAVVGVLFFALAILRFRSSTDSDPANSFHEGFQFTVMISSSRTKRGAVRSRGLLENVSSAAAVAGRKLHHARALLAKFGQQRFDFRIMHGSCRC